MYLSSVIPLSPLYVIMVLARTFGIQIRAEAAAEEQHSLVERCVAAESEVERLQGQLTQLRRKLDDSTAALHELGRENQNLQVSGE